MCMVVWIGWNVGNFAPVLLLSSHSNDTHSYRSAPWMDNAGGRPFVFPCMGAGSASMWNSV